MKKIISLLVCLMLTITALTAIGCGDKDENKIRIGVLQVATHTALDNARQGFEDTLTAWATENGKTVEFTRENANGDANNELSFAESLVTAKPDLVLGISTSSSRALANATEKIPVLFTAVTDPEGEQLLRNNVTGTSDLNPVADQIALIKAMVGDCKKIAFLYNSSENNSVLQFQLAQKKCTELGITLVGKTATQASEIQTVVESIGSDFDADRLGNVLSDFVRSLSERRRFIFMSRYYLSEPIETIARELNLSRSMINKELAAIRTALKEKLESEGYSI